MSSGISSKPEQAGHGASFVSFSIVFNNFFLPEKLNDLMDTSQIEQEKYSVKKGDIFLTRTSETVDELGMSCVVLQNYDQATYSGFLKRLRPTQNNITYAKYMAFYLRSKLFRKTMTNNAVLTLRASLNENIYSYLDLILPKYYAQKKIGDLLYLINSKIELNNRINTELESMAKTLYDYWFVQFDFPNPSTSSGQVGKPYKSSGGKMVFNEVLKREIPEGWEVVELGSLVNLINNNTSLNDVKPNTPYIGLEHIPRKTIILSEWNTAEKANSNKNLFEKHDILFGKIRPYFHKVGVSLINGITSTDTIILRAKKRELLGFSLEVVFTDEFVKTATKSSTGSKMPRADWNVLQHYKIPVPSSSELFYKYQESFDQTINNIELLVLQNIELIKLRDWLLPMLMNGQVTVK